MAMTTPATAPVACYASEAEIADLAGQFERRTLPQAAWTHHMHLTVGAFLLRRDGFAATSRDLPDRIRRYNEATGVPNNDERGYHETVTQFFLHLLQRYLDTLPPGTGLDTALNALPASRFGRKDIAFDFYSRDRLLSVAARRGWVEPDLLPLAELARLAP